MPTDNWPQRVAQLGTFACLLEATAPKPGNVHRGADFEDLTYLDFAIAARAIGPALAAAAAGAPLGGSVLAAIKATREVVASNVNLGTVLLLVPLAMAPRDKALSAGVPAVLASLGPVDARRVYEAIRLANPGGMGKVEKDDVAGEPPDDLLLAMRLAADRDLVARQYTNGFAEVLGSVVPWLAEGVSAGWPLADVIVYAQLRLMSEYPDSLIGRKCGRAVAEQAAALAAGVLSAGKPGGTAYHEALSDLDFWLRSDGHRRNPGTTADLVAAGLFAALRENIIKFPLRFYA
ncbi:MAG: triphosphoribosyl-dephospho-CoA synthase [Planctomycetia bacterium]|nr:triphosphoribosyl-dephospho-CoA synthase [Planctomycetia bacterium]